MTELTGRHVAAMFGGGFAVIITVNLALAFNAVRTFPGLEVKNSYVASQRFDAARAAQVALDWDVRAHLEPGAVVLHIQQGGRPVAPQIEAAVFGRATSVAADQDLEFAYDGASFVAPVKAAPGNWNLRLVARAADGTRFAQRIVVEDKL